MSIAHLPPISVLRKAVSWQHGVLVWTAIGRPVQLHADLVYCGSKYACTMVPRRRITWALHYGDWPDFAISKINTKGSDMDVSNLRAPGNV